MLHVTNGDSAAGKLRAAGIPGAILPWRDVLHDGPVPAGLTLKQLSERRAAYLGERGVAPADELLAGFRSRDARLEDCRTEDEVVLWFEHDLYDQLQLIQLLDWFADAMPACPGRAYREASQSPRRT